YTYGGVGVFPFYVNPNQLGSGLFACLGEQIETPYSLNFLDCPNDPLLPVLPGGFESVEFVAFTTSLVGVLPSGQPSAPLFTWTWESNYNGFTGGVPPQTYSVFPIG